MKKQRFSLNMLKKIPKNQLLIGGLAGVLLLVIAIPVDKKEKTQQEQMQELTQGQSSYEDTGDYGKRLERKLEQFALAANQSTMWRQNRCWNRWKEWEKWR